MVIFEGIDINSCGILSIALLHCYCTCARFVFLVIGVALNKVHCPTGVVVMISSLSPVTQVRIPP